VQRAALGSGRECAVQAAGENVTGADLVMAGHDEVWQLGLGREPLRECRIFAGNTVRPEALRRSSCAAREFSAR
jgi:hypothetical protein